METRLSERNDHIKPSGFLRMRKREVITFCGLFPNMKIWY